MNNINSEILGNMICYNRTMASFGALFNTKEGYAFYSFQRLSEYGRIKCRKHFLTVGTNETT